MPKNKDNLDFEKEIKNLSHQARVFSQGRIKNVGDGIATVSGLPNASYNEVLIFNEDVKGLAFNLKPAEIDVIILGDYKKLKAGDLVSASGMVLEIPGSEEFFGRVINPLGEPLDGRSAVKPKKMMPLEKIAPGVIKRQSVNSPLQTGIKAIDSMIPIGRGQRELIIGDRGTGKTAIAIDTIINQKSQNVICIYVSIGQKNVRIAQIKEKLFASEAMDYTIIVAANAADSASLQYIAPYSGCALAEYFMEQGKDVLIVYDDLSKHAWAYRQLSLLLKRPSGREAYPGDIFYLHSRLLERSCKLSAKYGGGSITSLPIIETQAGDVSAYIPTNVISITDGQIYLEPDLFFAGVRPAINVGLSVSRVGGSAQIKTMKKIAGQLRLELAQYREMAAFTQFSTDLDEETKKKIERGSRIAEIFKQDQYAPLSVELEIAIIFAAVKGHLDEIPTSLIKTFEENFLSFLLKKHQKTIKQLRQAKDFNQEIEKQLENSVNTFKKDFIKEHDLGKNKEENVGQS